jgi:FKBP-type peptidyl-prolyl cis-trans isomerase FkpA
MKPIKLMLVLLSFFASVVYADDESSASAAVVTTASGLQYIDTAVGSGDLAKAGDLVSLQYTGWVRKDDGSKGIMFDTSRETGRALEFKLGRHKVIDGWDEGINGMRVGGKRTLIIPSALAYGKRGLGAIVLPNQNLIFDVELVGIRNR